MNRHLLALLLLGGCAGVSSPVQTPVRLPTFELVRLSGPTQSLDAALRGSVAVIDLWATWCTACERERPKLTRLDAAYRAQGLRVIALNVGESPSVVKAYLAENSVPYAVYLDPDFRMADALGEHRLPSILVVDREGRIVHRASSLDQPTLEQVKTLLSLAPQK